MHGRIQNDHAANPLAFAVPSFVPHSSLCGYGGRPQRRLVVAGQWSSMSAERRLASTARHLSSSAAYAQQQQQQQQQQQPVGRRQLDCTYSKQWSS